MTTMTVSEARAALPELLNQVAQGAEITITRHGLPVAVVIRPDALHSRRAGRALADAERIGELLRTAATAELPERGLPGLPGLSADRAEELIREIRTGRDGQ